MTVTIWRDGAALTLADDDPRVADLAPTLASAKAAKQQAINAEWARRSRGGTILGGVLIQTDEVSQTQIRGAIEHLEAAEEGTEFTVRTRTGQRVVLSLATATAMRSAVTAHVVACAAREAALMDAVDDAETIAAVEAIDHTAGWP